MAEDDVLRKNRGLGMLLASMGNRNKDDTSKTVIPEASGEMQDNRPSGSKNSGDASASSRADKAAGGSQMNEQKNSDQGKSGNSSAGVQKQKPEGKYKRKNQDESTFGSGNMSSWASMKEYDDDHDSQWFEDENARLAELYGGNFIYAKYLDSQPGKVGYYCELCFAEMNARKSLELHCSGMKHLKKKAIWEKMDGQDEDSDRPERGPNQPPHKALRQSQRPRPPPRHPPPYGWQNRGPPPMDLRGPRPPMERSPYREPPPPEFRDNRGHFERRDDYDQYPDDYYDDYYRKEPMPYRPPFDEEPLYGRRRGSPGPRDFNRPPGPDRRDIRDRFSRERYDPYDRREAPPPPVISGPEGPGTGRMPPYPPQLGSPSALFEGISDGSCSELLKRLAVCRVKSMEDSALATNVTTFLVMSLKEYYSMIGPPSVVHVLEEINVKLNIMKDLLKVNPPR